MFRLSGLFGVDDFSVIVASVQEKNAVGVRRSIYFGISKRGCRGKGSIFRICMILKISIYPIQRIGSIYSYVLFFKDHR